MKDKGPERPTRPQLVYTAADANRQDLRRLVTFIFFLGLGFLIATIYLVFFLIHINNRYSLLNRSGLMGILIPVSAFIILIIPIFLEFILSKIVFGVSGKFLKSFYNISDEIVRPLIQRRLLGISSISNEVSQSSSSPYIIVNIDKLDNKFSWAYSIGGPARLIVYDGYAVYLERGNKFSRVVGSGIAFLERYETIRDIIDLRPQIKEIPIEAWTKDGIKLTVHVHLECQILSAKDAEASQRMDVSQELEKRIYPFYDKAVQAAVETAAVRLDKNGKPEKYDWVAGVCGNIEGHVRTHVYSNTIDDLLRGERSDPAQPEEITQQFEETDNGKPLTQLLSSELRNLLQARVNKDVERLGARLINLQINKVDKSLIVDQQWVENWSAEWKSLNSITAGEAEAYKIRTLESAHAEAQKDMILAIAEGLENVDSEQMREPLLLSLSGMLESSLVDPYVRAALPKETMETLEKLQNFLKEE